jgi:hypothetical protein
MKRLVTLTLVSMSGWLVACGSHDEPKQPDPPPVRDTAFGDLVRAEDKARGVQDTLQKQKEERDRQMEQQEASQSTDK